MQLINTASDFNHVALILSKARNTRRLQRNLTMSRKQRLKAKQVTYPVALALEDTDGFIVSFQERLTLLSPINEGVFECNG